MRIKSVLDKILDEASIFHCHIGPFLALGLKAGLRAIEVFGYNPHDMSAEIIVPEKKTPYTCFADGVQFVTGCTLGKGNIRIEDGGCLKAVFMQGSRSLELKVRKEILDELRKSSEDLEEIARKLMNANLSKLFEEKLL
ncbi:MAG: hypothetical protein J7K78_00955 [Thaumarchaeota archaeon]|nr:hypothetical protein [Nitrososphaerota archaeon]